MFNQDTVDVNMYAPRPQPPATATFPLYHSKTQSQPIIISPIERPSHPQPLQHPDEAQSSFRDFADARLRKSDGPIPLKSAGVRPQLRIVTAFASSDPTPYIVHRPRALDTHVQPNLAHIGDRYNDGLGVCCTAPLPHHYTQRSNNNEAQYNHGSCQNLDQSINDSNRGHTRKASINNREAFVLPIQPHSPISFQQPNPGPRKPQIQIQGFQPSRGHKRRLSDKLKTLIHKVRRRGSGDVDIDMREIGRERREGASVEPARMSMSGSVPSRLRMPEVEQVMDVDVADSGGSSQSQCLIATDNNEEGPIRPHRSPGTASFLVNRHSDIEGTSRPTSSVFCSTGSMTPSTAEPHLATRGWKVPLTQSRSAFVLPHLHPYHSDQEMDIGQSRDKELQSRFSFSSSSGGASTITHSESGTGTSTNTTSRSTPITPRLVSGVVDSNPVRDQTRPAFALTFNDHKEGSEIGSQGLVRRMSV